MFMRYRGGGIGHLYMRETEQWLNSSKWGSSWPSSLRDRDPNPDQELPPHNSSSAAATSAQSRGYGSDSTEGDLGGDSESDEEHVGSDPGELTDEDGDGDDPEHPTGDSDEGSDEDEGEEGEGDSRTQSRTTGRAHRRAKRAMEGIEEDETEEPEEEFNGDIEDIEEDNEYIE